MCFHEIDSDNSHFLEHMNDLDVYVFYRVFFVCAMGVHVQNAQAPRSDLTGMIGLRRMRPHRFSKETNTHLKKVNKIYEKLQNIRI